MSTHYNKRDYTLFANIHRILSKRNKHVSLSRQSPDFNMDAETANQISNTITKLVKRRVTDTGYNYDIKNSVIIDKKRKTISYNFEIDGLPIVLIYLGNQLGLVIRHPEFGILYLPIYAGGTPGFLAKETLAAYQSISPKVVMNKIIKLINANKNSEKDILNDLLKIIKSTNSDALIKKMQKSINKNYPVKYNPELKNIKVNNNNGFLVANISLKGLRAGYLINSLIIKTLLLQKNLIKFHPDIWLFLTIYTIMQNALVKM